MNFDMKPDAVYMVPLGGAGIFGCNMTLYGHKGQWIMVDCGMGFADDTMPGVDILLPDPSFAEELGDSLLGIVITHAHEDHKGALQHLWARFKKVPVYATPFAAECIRQDMSETPWGGKSKLLEIPPRGRISLGPFTIDTIRMCHSIPEARALSIAVSGVGTIVHTGDWKIDDNPVVGDKTDGAALKALGDAGVLAMVCDSTNAMVPGHSGSEIEVQKGLIELFGEFKSAIVISCFSTNVARLRSIYEAARANSRHVCLVGRSLWSIDAAARKTGYLSDIPPFLDDEQAESYPAENIVYICTGSQGEPRAALTRISNDDHPALKVMEGDVVIFSSRVIPGNERAIDRIKNRLLAKGVHIVTDREAMVHVSGHPYRDELKQMYAWVRPKIAIPVHGEQMQLEKHADLAAECGAAQQIIPQDGDVIEITAAGAAQITTVRAGLLAVEGKRLTAVDHDAILTRKRMMWNGSAIVTLVVDEDGQPLAPPKITALGLIDENSAHDQQYLIEAIAEVQQKVRNMPKAERRDDAALSELVRVTVRRYFSEKFDRKPQTRVHLVRV